MLAEGGSKMARCFCCGEIIKTELSAEDVIDFCEECMENNDIGVDEFVDE